MSPPPLITLGDSELVLHSLNSWSLYTWTLNTLTHLLPSASATDQTQSEKNPFLKYHICPSKYAIICG